MNVTTIKKYTGTYRLCSVMPRNVNTSTPPQRVEACRSVLNTKAYDEFVKETNRYRSIPTPKYSQCKIALSDEEYEVDDEVVTLLATVTVEWIHEG